MKKTKISDKPRVPSPFDTTIHKTERTAVAIVMHWIREIITKKNLPLGPPDVDTTAIDRKSPDIVIYDRPTSQKALCVIEFKPPYFDIFDEKELKEPAREKATNRKAKFFATSNFQRLIWYNTERVNSFRPEEEQIHDKYLLSQIENLDLIEEPKCRNSIIAGLERFLTDLYEVHTGKKPEPKQAIDEFLIFRLQEKINRLSSYYEKLIEDKAHKDSEFSFKLQKWFVEQNWSFGWQEEDFFKAARQTAYLLINKILFYDLLQAKRPSQLDPLSIPDDLSKGGILQRHLQSYFDYVLQNIDYETIYSTDFIDQTAFPDNSEVVEEIKELVQVLKRYDFSRLGYDIIGRIFERLIPAQERHNLGQYFTNPDIIDLILRFCLRHEEDKVFDPACGAGTFLVRVYQHKKLMNQRLSHEQILNTLWGCDIAKFPAHLSTINLAINDLGVDENYPQIICEDFFSLRLGGRKEFKKEARKRELVSLGEKKIFIPYPKIVDCVIGNPPYTRQEEIPSISGDGEYKKKLIRSALYDGSEKIAEISKRAGIYAYFFIHGTKFLQNKGKFGFIVSSSWLDVDYGKGLQEFFLKNYRIIAIIESKVERWFPDADINTCIVILEKCSGERYKKERDDNLVRFVYLFRSLRYFIPPAQDMWEKQVNRLNEIGKLKRTILGHSEFYQNEELRIFPKLQSELWEEGFDEEKGKYVGAKWGKYIRAPESFFRILKKGKDKLVPLKEVAEVRRGFTTGADPWFYVEDLTDSLSKNEFVKIINRKRDQIKKESLRLIKSGDGTCWLIEEKYLLPVTRNPDVFLSTRIREDDIKTQVVLITASRKNLKGQYVERYVKHGERKLYKMGKGRRMIPAKTKTCSSREYWYQLPNIKPSCVLWQKAIDRYHRHYLSDTPTLANQRFYNIYPKLSNDELLIACSLNSSFTSLYLEFQRVAMGLGAIEATVEEVCRLPVLNPVKISKTIRKRLVAAFYSLYNRPVESIFEEVKKKDRQNLDMLMLEALGFGDTKERSSILHMLYEELVDLTKARLTKSKSVAKREKTKGGIDIDLLTKTMMKKIGSETLGKFYQEKILNQKVLYSKTLPERSEEIKIERDLYGWRLYSGRRSVECKSESEARYLKVWLEAGVKKVKIPKDKYYLKNIVSELEVIKKEIDKMIDSYLSSILDIKLRNRILHQLWQHLTEGVS